METGDSRGRARKVYPAKQIMTPWDHLPSVPGFEQSLKPGVTVHDLHQTAMAMTHARAADKLQTMRSNLLASFRRERTRSPRFAPRM